MIMEIRLGSYAMALSAAMLLAACSGENPWQEAGGGKGTLVLNLPASSHGFSPEQAPSNIAADNAIA